MKKNYTNYQKKKVIKMNENQDKGLHKSAINWYPGHMAKTRREIKEMKQLVDLVYEVIDARMPISSKIHDIDDLLKDKKRILVVTKYDMCDKKVTDVILQQYEREGYIVIPIDLVHGKCDKLLQTSRQVLQEMNEKRKEKGLKSKILRVLVVGVPNVGKSTLINRFAGEKKAKTGNQPGVTKQMNWIRVGKDIELLDSPGILWPKLENQEQARILAALSSIKEEILDLFDLSTFVLEKISELYPDRLQERYGITTLNHDDILETYQTIAKRRGALLRGGEIDYDKVAKIILQDLKDGKLGPITLDR